MLKDNFISFFSLIRGRSTSFNEENPCFGCKGLLDGKKVKAPCCHSPTILGLDEAEYVKHFLRFYLKGKVDCDELVDCENGDFASGDFSLIYFVDLFGACPHLATRTGKCKIQDDKPKSCKEAEPGNFVFCIL